MSANTAKYFEITPSSPAWVELLQTKRIGDIINPNQHVISVNFFETVSSVLQILSEKKILCAVVTVAEKPGVLGFVDVLDILSFALNMANESKDFTKQSFRNMKWEGKCFSEEYVGNIINQSQRDTFKPVELNTPLIKVVELFAEEVHRVPVMQDGKVIGIFSQSDLVKYVASLGVYLGSKLERPIAEVGLEPLGVLSVLDTVIVLDALRYIKEQKISAVAVLDKNGRLVANFSGSDLLGLNEDSFPALALPIKDYLTSKYGYPKPPVYVRTSDKVEMVLLKMVVHEVHRVYIVDDSMHATGVITMTDVMQFLLSV